MSMPCSELFCGGHCKVDRKRGSGSQRVGIGKRLTADASHFPPRAFIFSISCLPYIIYCILYPVLYSAEVALVLGPVSGSVWKRRRRRKMPGLVREGGVECTCEVKIRSSAGLHLSLLIP